MSRRLPAVGSAVSMGVGVLVLGVSSYVFLLVAGRELGDAAYAPLGAMWMLLFLVGPGLFFPVEQELGRAVATRQHRGVGALPVIRRAATLVAGALAVLLLVGLAMRPVLIERLFDGQSALFWALYAALAAMALGYLARGSLEGLHRFDRYGALMAGEGLTRMIGAVVLLLIGAVTAVSFGFLVAAAGLAGVLCGVIAVRRLTDDGPPARWRELTASLGVLIVASLCSQALANAGPLLVQAWSPQSAADTAGAFAKAVILMRIPLFLFQAVQALMLPRLTTRALQGDRSGFVRILGQVLGVVAVMGVVFVVASALLGPLGMRIFGSVDQLSRLDLVLLAGGSVMFLFAMACAQALVALHAQVRSAVGWAAAVLAAAVALYVLSPAEVVLRVELALLMASTVAFVVMGLALRRPLAAIGAAPTPPPAEDPALEGGAPTVS